MLVVVGTVKSGEIRTFLITGSLEIPSRFPVAR